MKENSEEDIKNIEEIIELSKKEIDAKDENMTAILDIEDLISLKHILSDYKRVLEINEFLLKENEILKEEKEQAWEEWNNLERGNYETEQKLKQQIKELQKKNDELKKLMAHKNWYTQKLEEDLFENASNYVIKKEKVKDKIKEIGEKIRYEENEKVVIYLHKQKNILQELLKESEEEHDGK